MVKQEEGKSDKLSSPTILEQNNSNVYSDWAAMQAYYGAGVPIRPFYNSVMASGHSPHHYIWGAPQAMMPPYGMPYGAIYQNGGVYAHPKVPMDGTRLRTDTPSKSSENTDHSEMKKLDAFDGITFPIGNSNHESSHDGTQTTFSHRLETEGCSSDGNTRGASHTKRKRSQEAKPTNGSGGEIQAQSTIAPQVEVKLESVAQLSTIGKPGALLSSNLTTALEPQNSSEIYSKSSPSSISQPGVVMSHYRSQSEREVKRERRKQSNRESARKSRLKKQAETEALACKVESLNNENTGLKSKLSKLKEITEKLTRENSVLKAKVKDSDPIQNNLNDDKTSENLMVRVNEDDNNVHDKDVKSSAKLHHFLDTNQRDDSVVAG